MDAHSRRRRKHCSVSRSMDTSNVSSVDDSVLQMFGSEGMQQFISLGAGKDPIESNWPSLATCVPHRKRFVALHIRRRFSWTRSGCSCRSECRNWFIEPDPFSMNEALPNLRNRDAAGVVGPHSGVPRLSLQDC
jgi:hypothetical protein